MRVAIAIVTALGLLAAPAAAGDDATELEERINTHLERAVEFYAEKQYELAIVEFRAAFALDPRPDLLFALAQAERLSGDCPTAVVYYERYLETDPDEEQAEAARVNMNKCERALESGPHGRPETSTDQALDKAEQASEPPPPAPIAPSLAQLAPRAIGTPWYRDTLGDALLVSGIVGLAVGGGFWAASSAAENSAESAVLYEDYVSHIDTARQRRTYAVVGFATGGALVGAALVRFLLRDNGATKELPTIGAAPSDNGVVVSATGRF